MKNFNLIVSTYRFREEEAQDEILDLLETFDDAEAECEITEIRGILLVRTLIDPVQLISKLKELTAAESWRVRYVLRVLPVMRVVPTDLHDISDGFTDIRGLLQANDTFRITIEKRHTSLESGQIIEVIASKVRNKVDLDNPDWIILVQIVGAQTGLSILRPDQIFSSVVEKRK